MAVSFPFKKERSPIFGTIFRPVAEVSFKHQEKKIWQSVTMLVDTGADYTLLPEIFALELGINLITDCRKIGTRGVGGKSTVYLFKRKITAKLGNFERQIPIGFLANGYIPPLLGRQEFLETFKVVFDKFYVQFEETRYEKT